ncbi:MAG: SMC family ATPase [Muribaculaceae bacterium]|nr:SMC family ATPase [Muribaculaceae bacterium]
MRIRRLAIRNIASIQEADIDFENDLRNFGETDPATLFLISGDTGSGKTVILDCISMALYGTTPRVKGVSAKRNNSFAIREGEEISLTDIAQYTRMGITWKDDCYSRLTFVGNDGVEYISTFSLGVTNRGNLRDASWTLEIGGKEIIQGSKKEEIKNRIKAAIGLSYHQFSRMAMLAQGEFADFLTGGKEEREKILEQLTNTGQFSRYGEAIERIFKRAKQDKDMAATLMDSERRHLLHEDEESDLLLQKENLTKEIEAITKEKNQNDLLISGWNDFHDHIRERLSIKKELRENKTLSESEEFLNCVDTVKKWDESNNERNLLLTKQTLSKSITDTINRFANLRSGYDTLCLDLNRRKGQLSESKSKEKELNECIEKRENEKNLYLNLPVVEEKVASIKSLQADISEYSKRLKFSIDRSPEIQRNRQVLLDKVKNCEEEVAKLRNLREEKTNERNSLHPEEISQTLHKLSKRHSLLENCLKDFDNFVKLCLDFSEMKKESEILIAECENLKKEKEAATQVWSERKKRFEEADSRYTTMHLSMSENFSALRKRLAHDHSKSCPLCGGEIDWEKSTLDKETFSKILSPLEEERAEAREAMVETEKSAKETEALYNLKGGELNSRNKSLDNNKKKIDSERILLEEKLKAQGISLSSDSLAQPDNNLRSMIVDLLDLTASDIEKNTEQSKKSENLQKEINEILKKLDPIEKDLTRQQNLLATVETELKVNDQAIIELTRSIDSTKEKIETGLDTLGVMIKDKYPDWRDTGFSFMPLLKKEAEEYLSMRDRLVILQASNKFLEENLAYVVDIKERISLMFEKVGKSFSFPLSNPDEKIKPSIQEGKEREVWNDLLTQVSAETNRLFDLHSRQSEIINHLNEYYLESNTTEEDLLRLAGLEISIPEMRIRIENTLRKIQSLSDRVKYHSDKAVGIFDKLLLDSGAGGWKEIPRLDVLSGRNEIIGIQLQQKLRILGSITNRLAGNEENKKNLQSLLADFEKKTDRFAKWDTLNRYFGGSRFRTLVQSYILRPLLRNANLYLNRITDRFTLTCSDNNEQLSILVLDRYNKNKVRSATVLSGGERFMISLALSLALSAMNKANMNVDILFIDEGFGTLDASTLNAVIDTLRRLPEIAGQNGRRVGVISHREELADRIDVKIKVKKCGEGRSRISIEK